MSIEQAAVAAGAAAKKKKKKEEYGKILLALPRHQQTSFLDPDVSDRVALSFFKELLNKQTKSSRLKTKKQKTKYNFQGGGGGAQWPIGYGVLQG